ncbi:MAG: hypothetical protein KBT27_14815 [Prevotellaceae bacterium]|nr:hypothetical protein [Candidatus Faecinaster equi]
MKPKNFKFKSMALVLFALVLSSNVWGVDDVLTRATTGVTSGSTSYSTWSNKTVSSDAVYAGNSAGDKDAIQLRSNNSNSGIVTTASGGKATKVVVSWNSGTASGRTIDIYGKNSAYTQATDLYSNNASTKGTKLGSIAIGSTTLNIAGDYEYIGIRSNSGALYLNSITITWTTASTYDISYSLDGGSHGTTHPTSGTIGTAFYVSAPSKSGYTFTGWKVTSGLNSTTAKWGTSSTPSTSISSSSTLCVNGATGDVYFKDLGAANASVTLTANWQVNKTISSIAVTTSPKTNYTTCEKLVVSDWEVTATYSDASTGDVTSGCTFSPANGSALTAGEQTVTVTHTASGKTTTKTVTVTQGARDTFKDNVQGTADQYGECNYTIPSCGDKTKDTGCEGEHYKFIGWSSERIQTGEATEPSGLLKAGNKHDADGTTYYAVWAKEAE